MIRGSCLCGTVRWQIEGDGFELTHCHCTMCRKAHGAAFATYMEAPGDGFAFTAGEQAIVEYESSPGFIRAFCGTCGSVVPSAQGSENVFVPAGCLDDDPGVRPVAHIFVPAKAPWHEITGDLPQYDAYENPEDGPNIDLPEKGPASEGVLRGSCLCGDVTYEVTGAFTEVHNCHCSRCRKARAAAHTTNGFTTYDGVRFLTGETGLRSYKVPGAEIFTHVFCGRCGSGMPRRNKADDVSSVPFGSLDDDPHRTPDDHIYVGSKAPWYEITDTIKQFDGEPE